MKYVFNENYDEEEAEQNNRLAILAKPEVPLAKDIGKSLSEDIMPEAAPKRIKAEEISDDTDTGKVKKKFFLNLQGSGRQNLFDRTEGKYPPAEMPRFVNATKEEIYDLCNQIRFGKITEEELRRKLEPAKAVIPEVKEASIVPNARNELHLTSKSQGEDAAAAASLEAQKEAALASISFANEFKKAYPKIFSAAENMSEENRKKIKDFFDVIQREVYQPKSLEPNPNRIDSILFNNIKEKPLTNNSEPKFNRIETEKDFFDKVYKFTNDMEGKTYYPYLDSKGLITTGSGKNVNNWNNFKKVNWYNKETEKFMSEEEKKELYDTIRQFRENLQEQYNNRAYYYENKFNGYIKEEEVKALFTDHIKGNIDELNKICDRKNVDFNNLPPSLRMAMIDLRYNLGDKFDEIKYKNFFNALTKMDFDKMATQSSRKAAVKRNEKIVDLIREAEKEYKEMQRSITHE